MNQTDSRNSQKFGTVWHYLVNLQTFGILFCHLCQKWCSSATCSQKTSWGDNISVTTFKNCFHVTNCVVAVMLWSLNSNWFFLSEMTLCLKSERLNNSLKSSSRFIRRNLWVAFAISWIPPFARFPTNYISSENFTTFINPFLRMMLHQRIMSHSSLSESGYWLRWYCFVSFAM